MRSMHLLAGLASLLLVCSTVGAADRALNNFVVEHVDTAVAPPRADHSPFQPVETFTFDTPRDGWLFFQLKTGGGGVRVCLYTTDRAEAVLASNGAARRPVEAMRFVGKGTHTVRVYANGEARVERLVVRSIPEILLFPVSFAAWRKETSSNYGIPHDWDFFKKHMLMNSNAIAFFNAEDFGPYIREWKAAGKKALIKKNIPYYGSTPDQIYENWGLPLEKFPELDGLTIDEFGAGEQHQKLYATWAGVLDRIGQNPLCRGRKAYTFWGSGFPTEKMRTLIEAVQRNNFRWLHEGYYMHRRSEGLEAGQLRYITAWGGNKFEQFRKMYPGLIENHLLYTFGIYNYHWTCDLAPELDFKVFLDLQFHHIASHPAFKGMYGICLYTLNSTTDEMCRYGSALVRHYCIEGKSERFNPSPLELPYIRNPGFEAGTKRWQLRPAAKDSIEVIDVASLPYKNTVTDRAIPNEKKVLCTTRSKTAPNVISQSISNLEPGAYYSVRVMVSDLTDAEKPTGLTAEEKVKLVPIAITVEGADMIEDKSIDRPWTTRFTKTDGDEKVIGCWNFRFRVFRAKGKEAVLTLSDWPAPSAPGGDVGHKVIWDFIKVQSFFAGLDL